MSKTLTKEDMIQYMEGRLKEERKSIYKEIQQLIKGLEEDMEYLDNENKLIRSQNEELKKQVNDLQRENNTLKKDKDKEIRRKNVVIFNLKRKTEDSERKISPTETARMFLSDLLEEEKTRMDFAVLSAKRLGNEEAPLLVECISEDFKKKIMRNSKKLKNTQIWVRSDYTKEERILRKKIIFLARKFKQEGLRTRIAGTKLFVNEKEVDVLEEFAKTVNSTRLSNAEAVDSGNQLTTNTRGRQEGAEERREKPDSASRVRDESIASYENGKTMGSRSVENENSVNITVGPLDKIPYFLRRKAK